MHFHFCFRSTLNIFSRKTFIDIPFLEKSYLEYKGRKYIVNQHSKLVKKKSLTKCKEKLWLISEIIDRIPKVHFWIRACLHKVFSEKLAVTLLEGIPENSAGEIIFCYQDNLNTDGIYPGKYTYIDDFTPDQMAKVVMENYDPEFGNIVEEGDIIVWGYNFGTGSSREQAATSLMYRGIQMVFAGSFSQTYKRNAINNGFLVMEVPELLKDLVVANKECESAELEISSKGLARINFSVDDYTAQYYMVAIDEVD